MTLKTRRALNAVVPVLILLVATVFEPGTGVGEGSTGGLTTPSRIRDLKHGNRSLQAFVVYPEVKTKVSVVILIHEIFGLSDWAKEMADELAAQGFIVVAPDFCSRAMGQMVAVQVNLPGRTPPSKLSLVWIRMGLQLTWTRQRTTASTCPRATAR